MLGVTWHGEPKTKVAEKVALLQPLMSHQPDTEQRVFKMSIETTGPSTKPHREKTLDLYMLGGNGATAPDIDSEDFCLQTEGGPARNV